MKQNEKLLYHGSALLASEHKQNGAARLLRFVYMVEDKMKKMKNCYLQLLIYPKDVSY